MSVCIYCCCVFLLVKLFSASSSGTGVIYKSVCIGNDVQIYQNIPSDNGTSEISLYTNGANRNLIGIWPMKNSVPTVLQNGYEGKVFRDESGIIWIRNVNLSDEAKYVIQYESYGFPTKSEVQIEVIVAPTKDCKPKVKRMNTSLDASLETSVCGKPAVSVYWRDFHGNLFRNKTVKLPPKKEAGTYNVCIDGPALHCVNTSRNYCSKYTIEEHSRDVSVCQGNRVQLFESNNTDVDVSIYKYGANNTFIASWCRKTSIKTSSLQSEYEEKVILVKNGDIWMQNVNVSDEGKYVIYCESDGFSAVIEVQIEVLVAPSRHCQPKIEVTNDNILQTSVESKDCGKPLHVSLRDKHGNLYRSQSIKLPSVNEDDTSYIACFEGPAIKCVNSSAQSDYCSAYFILGSNSPQSSEIPHVITPVYVVLVIILVIILVILLVIVIPKLRKRWRKLRSNVDEEISHGKAKISNAESNKLKLDDANASVPLLPQSTGKEAQTCTSLDKVEIKTDCSSQVDKESDRDNQQISNVERSSKEESKGKVDTTTLIFNSHLE